MKNNDELDTKAMEFISKYKELTDDKKLSFIKEVDNDLLIHILNPQSINQTDSDDLKEDILKYIFQDESKAKEIVNSIDDTRQLMNLVERFAKNITGTIKKICSLPTEKEQEGPMIQSSRTKLIQEFSALLNAIELSDEKKLSVMSETELTNTIKQTEKLKMVVEVFIKEIIEGIDKIIANEKEESMNELKKRIRTLLYEIFANVLSKSNSRHKQMIVLKAIADSIRMIKEYRESVDEVFAKILEKIDIAMPNNTEAVKKTFIAIVYMYSSNGYAIDTTDKILEKIDDKKLKSVLKSVLEQEKIEKVSISDNMSVENAAKTLMNDMDYITAAITLVNMECSRAANILKHIISYPRGNFYNAVLLSWMSAWSAAKILKCMDIWSAAKILKCMDIWSAASILGCMSVNSVAKILRSMSTNSVGIKSAAGILECMNILNVISILEHMSTNSVGVDSAAKILQHMSIDNVGSAVKIMEHMIDKNVAATILGCMEDSECNFNAECAARILGDMSTNSVGVGIAAEILQRMIDKNVCSAEDVLGCMTDKKVAAGILERMNILNEAVGLQNMNTCYAASKLQCMKDANNKFDSNSVAKILGSMKDANNAAKILQWMKDANNKFDIKSAAGILECMSTNSVGVKSAAGILGCMSTNSVGVKSAAGILECMNILNVISILEHMSTNSVGVDSAAKILQHMSIDNVGSAVKIMEHMIDKNVNSALIILKYMYAWSAAGILECMKDNNVAAKILESMIDNNVAAKILGCMIDKNAASILGCMNASHAAKILGCMIDSEGNFYAERVAKILESMSTNSFGVDSAAKILQRMSTDSVGSAAEILRYMTFDKIVFILQRMSTDSVDSAAEILQWMIDNNVGSVVSILGRISAWNAADILQRMSTKNVNSAAEILQWMIDKNVAATILGSMIDKNAAATILGSMIDKNAAGILECMIDKNAAGILECMPFKEKAFILGYMNASHAAKILQLMSTNSVESAADILGCMIDKKVAAKILGSMSTNDVGVDSAAKILGCMSIDNVGSAAEILQRMSTDSVGVKSAAEILECMSIDNVGSAAKILQCMSTNSVGVGIAAKILGSMIDKNAAGILECMPFKEKAFILGYMNASHAAKILQLMSTNDVGVKSAADILGCMIDINSAAEILGSMSTNDVGVDSAAKILGSMSIDIVGSAAKILGSMSTNDVGVKSAAEILGSMSIDNVGSAAKILQRMSTDSVGVGSAAKILGSMIDKNAAGILECMPFKEKAFILGYMNASHAAKILQLMSTNDVGVKSAADILGCMIDINSAAEILGSMSTNDVGVDSAAKILGSMSIDIVGSAAKILQRMSTDSVGVKSAAEILGSMSIDNVGSAAKILQRMSTDSVGVGIAAKILGSMIDKNAAGILKCMIDKNVAATILGCMIDKNAANILGSMNACDAAGILECMKDSKGNFYAECAAGILECMKDSKGNFYVKCVARILKSMGIYNVERVAEILQRMKDNSDIGAENVAKTLDCISHKNPDLRNDIQKCMDGIRIAKELNEIGVSNIDEIKKMLKDSECEITAILFKTLNNNVAKAFVTKVMTSEDMRLLINELIRTNNYEVMYKLLSAIGINTSKDESHTSNDNNSKKQEKQNVYVVVQVMKVLAVMIQTMIGMEDKRIDWENVIFREFVTYTINHIFMKEETKKLIIDIDLIYNTVCNGNNQKTGINYKGNEQQNGSENSLTNWNWIEKIAFDILFKGLNNGEEFIDPKYEPIVKQIIEKLKPSANNYEVSQAKEQTGTDGDDKTIVEIDIPGNVSIKVKPIWIMILNYLQGEEKKPLMILFTVLFLACLSVNNQSIDVTQQPAVQANK
ncbi:hypothetical protein OCOL_000222 [Ordospora colligata]